MAELADALNRLSAALATSEGREREFLLSVSHELRTPLTAVRGYAEALADGVVPPADVGRTGPVMLAEAERLDRLVGDLLDLARLRAQDFRLDLGDVDLTQLVQQAGEVWRDRCGREGVELLVQTTGAPLVVRTDPTRVRQIVDGLAENALRVTPAGRPIVLASAPTRGCPAGSGRGPRRRPRAHRRGPAGGLRALRALRALPRRAPGRDRLRSGARARPRRCGWAATPSPDGPPRAAPGSPSACRSGERRRGCPRPGYPEGRHRTGGAVASGGAGPRVSVLDDILDGVRADLAERQALLPLDDLKAAAAARRPAIDGVAALRGDDGVRVIAEVKRSSPSKGELARDRRPGRARRRLRGRRRRLHQRAHRAAPVRRLAGRPRRGARRRRRPGAAQGLRRLQLPAVGGPRPRRRPGAAHRRRARAAGAGLPRRARRVASG